MKLNKLFIYLFPLLLVTTQASQQEFNNNNNNLEYDNKDKQFQESIANLLPEFFERSRTMLNKIQEGTRQGVVVIGKTSAGKSTLIGGLLGHKFVLERQTIHTMRNGRSRTRQIRQLVNKNPKAPEIGYNKVSPKTRFPAVYCDPTTSLAFIDTAGLGDDKQDGEAINLCNAITLRSLIEKIGEIKCIIGVVNYHNFIVGRGSKAFYELLYAIRSLLKNNPPETITSSIILAFSQVPSDITKEDINDELDGLCDDFINAKDKMKKHYNEIEKMYKLLFPSFYNIKKRDVPYFLIRQNDLLKQGLVRNSMLPTLQNAEKIHKKHIGLMLDPYLLEKTRDWLRKRGESVASDIRHKEKVENNIKDTNKSWSFKRDQLREEEKLLNQLQNPDSKDKRSAKKNLIDLLSKMIKRNSLILNELDKMIDETNKKRENAQKKIKPLDTGQVTFYKKIAARYDEKKCRYEYNYKDVPINHIIYDDGDKIKDPNLDDVINLKYKVTSITKNYDEGILNITLGGRIELINSVVPIFSSWLSPSKFDIYAKKKDIYNNRINTLNKTIKDLSDSLLNYKQKEKNKLEKETKKHKKQLNQVENDLLKEEVLIKSTKNEIKTKKDEIKKIQSKLQNLKNESDALAKRLMKNEIIPYIIIQVAPFIEFHNNQQHNIDVCKRYIKDNIKQNNLEDNTNSKHSDYQPGGLWLGNNNTIKDDEEIKEDDSYKENISSSSNRNFSVTSSVTLGTVGIISRLKKKN